MRVFILSYLQLNLIKPEITDNDSIFLLEGYLSFLKMSQIKESFKLDKDELFKLRDQILKYTIEESKKPGVGINLVKLFELELNKYLNLFMKNYIYFSNLSGNDFIIIDDGSIEIQIIKEVLSYLGSKYSVREQFGSVRKPFKLQCRNFILKIISGLKSFGGRLFGIKTGIFIMEGNGNPLTDVIINRIITEKKDRIISIFPNPKNLIKYYFFSRYKIITTSSGKKHSYKTYLPELSKLNCLGVELKNLIPGFLLSQEVPGNLIAMLDKISIQCKKNKIKKALFLFDRYPFQRLLIKLFKENKIPTYMIQHGIFGGLYPPIEVENLFIWGQKTQQLLVSQQNKDLDYINTGNYLYRNYLEKYKNPETERRNFKEKYGIEDEKEILLYVTQPNDLYFLENDSYENLEHLLSAYKNQLEKFFLIIKVHPRESEQIYHDLIKSQGLEQNVLILRWFDPYRLLSICNRIIFMFSTMGLDAMVFDKEIFMLNLTGFKDFVGFEVSNSINVISDRSQLDQIFSESITIDKLLKEKFLLDFIGNYKSPGESIIIKELTGS